MISQDLEKIREILKREGVEYDDTFIECDCPLCTEWKRKILQNDKNGLIIENKLTKGICDEH